MEEVIKDSFKMDYNMVKEGILIIAIQKYSVNGIWEN